MVYRLDYFDRMFNKWRQAWSPTTDRFLLERVRKTMRSVSPNTMFRVIEMS